MHSSTHSLAHTRNAFRIAGLLALLLAAPSTVRAQLTLLGETIQEHRTRPGATVTDSVIIANPTDGPLGARVYLTDYVFDAAGSTKYDPAPSHARSNATWIVLGGDRIVVPPHSTASIRYTMHVPPEETRSGSLWAMMMVEGIDPVEDPAARAVGFRAAVRYGIQIVAHMPATGEQNASITAPRMVRTDSGAAVEFDLTNTGERAYPPMLTLELYDEQGRKLPASNRQRGLLFPGTGLRQRFELPGITPGAYEAVILVDTGLDEVFAARISLRESR